VTGAGLPRARKRLGQHFLNDPRILDRIVAALAPRHAETIIEIGPGRGSLTERLAPRCARLIAIELDRVLAPALRERFAAQSHVSIVEADVLDTDLGALASGPYALIGNVPYYITTPILFHALTRPRADRAVYLVQREVADRLVAGAGSDAYGALSVNVQAVAHVERVFRVGAGAFTPPPKVESAVIRITPRNDPVVVAAEEDGFRRFVQAAFAQRRKQLKSVVRATASVDTPGAVELLNSLGFSPEARAETLSPAELARLYRGVSLFSARLGSS
jgi:16S rRNA (adenine1518-N6/adenine1519-N6)-dimethyltransferase